MGTTPDEIRNEIEHTRAGLGADVDRIVDRASPRRVMRRRTDRARAAVRGVRERLMGMPDIRRQESGAGDGITGPARDAAETVRERGEQAAQAARQGREQAMETARYGVRQTADAVGAAPERAKETTRGNPLAAGVVAFGVGLVAASLLPSAPPERTAGRRVRERADEVTEPIERVAAEPAQRLASETGDTAREAAQHVGEAAADAARTTGEQAREHGQDVAGHARESAGSVRDQAR
ncbi:DUF3618 domain-containing protein [Actinoallomurus iriomotensis]|uniref:DUF3618 domain-containing protein n=1 Tax=Actinoallomurus iriomotensis TaxID=478107 RepID=A0A9W6S3M0_9ACTN|nr:DUF3618 domain-containing protein [Actinoallomurus iriomotensis]GLY85152.1 hypothetical protein Airi02_030810 [Actinoallomurus iriomotensis]